MFKKALILFVMMFLPVQCFAGENAVDDEIQKINSVQTRIENVGVSVLNSNKLDKRIVFVFDETEAKKKLKLDKTLLDRQVIVYGYNYRFIEDDNELAAFLSRRIAEAFRSYDGALNGRVSSLKMKAAPKKYQIIFDKVAVDYMVRAGYNPVAMITLINKSHPQKRNDAISNTNLTSKRLAIIYEYIYTKYPYYLKHNEYFANKHYQNFLLTSRENRKMLEEKVKSRSRRVLQYE